MDMNGNKWGDEDDSDDDDSDENDSEDVSEECAINCFARSELCTLP